MGYPGGIPLADKQARIRALRDEIAALEALRGTPQQPPALDAQVGQLQRTLRWHESRLEPPHHNTGSASIYERNGRSKRTTRRFDAARDYPVVQIP